MAQTRLKQSFLIFGLTLALLAGLLGSPSLTLAADNNQLPGRFTYVKEWVSLHLLTWKSESKLALINDLSTKRANEIKAAETHQQSNQTGQLITRYAYLTKLMGKSLQTKTKEQLEVTRQAVIEQQVSLSEARQATTNETTKTQIAQVQEEVVNQVKALVQEVKGQDEAKDFSNEVVAVWRDPQNTINDPQEELATRVYAAGSQGSDGNSDSNGVIIDQGQGQIIENDQGELKIEYAPGTGPSSVTADNGQRVWKIQQSDGSVIESYNAASQVVIGSAGTTTGNVVVNTINGETGGPAQVISGGNSGQAGVTIEGSQGEVEIKEDSSSGQTVIQE